jgi:N-acetylneuraminic acid mutarotase
MALSDINALLEYSGATEAQWNAISIPLSINMLAYAKDTKVFKIGDGINSFSDLPIAYQLTEATKINTIVETFPEFSSEIGNKLVLVSPEGDGYITSDIDITALANRANFDNQVITKSTVEHSHGEEYLTSDQAHEILSVTKNLKFESQDIVSQLILKDMEETERDILQMSKSFADEFNDTTHINTTDTTMEYSGTSYIPAETEDNKIVSEHIPTIDNITSMRAMLRGTFDGIPNADHYTELSRDNGDTWALVNVEKSAICTSSLDTIVGICDFDKALQEHTLTEIEMDVEDIKGDCTTFVIDTENLRGHFTTPINSRICEGCRMYLVGGAVLNILDIKDVGDSANSVLIDNDISIGTYTVEKIIGIVSEDVSVNTDGRIELKTPIPIAIHVHTATLYQDKIYVIGGWNSTSNYNTTYIYDIINDTWNQGANIPIAVRAHTATLYQDKIYVMGGWNGTSNYNTTYIYDIPSNTWSTGANVPIAVRAHTATLYQDKIYVMGGIDGTLLNTTHIYDITNNTWSTGVNMPIAVWGHTATLYQDKIYVIGGYDGTTYFNTTYIYDITNNTWSTGANVPITIHRHTATPYQDKIYVIGGSNGTLLNTTYIYDIPSNTWSTGVNVPEAISTYTTIFYSNKLYNIGGISSTANIISSKVYTYSLGYDISDIHVNTPKKTIVEGEMGEIEYKTNMPKIIFLHTATLYQDKIYVMGGWDVATYLNTTYICDIINDTWSTGANMPQTMHQHTATRYQDKIYVIGGWNGTSNYNTTYIYDITNNTWSTGANMPIAVHAHTATLYRDKIYVMGGVAGTTRYKTTYIYDIINDTWSTGANIPIVMQDHTATLCQDKIYVIGGYTGTSYYNTVYIYDIVNDTWSQGASMPQANHGHTATLYQGKIYVMGGDNHRIISYNSVHIYDILTNTWSQGINMPRALASFKAAIAYNNYIYTFGGRSWIDGAYQYSNRVFTYSLQSNITYTPELNKYQTATFQISNFDGIHITIPNTVRETDNIYYTIQFAHDENTYYVYQNNEWKPIVRLTDIIWEYRNGSIWHPATINNSKTAISQAVSISTNQMNTQELSIINNRDYREYIPTKISVSMNCNDISYVPSISGIYLSGTKDIVAPEGKDLKWRFTSKKQSGIDVRGIRLLWG